jgi:hypothetical protein
VVLEKDGDQLDRSWEKEVLHRVKEDRNILHTINRKKAKWIGHILRRKCLLNHVVVGNMEGRIEVMGGREKRRRQLMGDLKKKKGYSKLKEETLYCNLWRTRFGRGYRPVMR